MTHWRVLIVDDEAHYRRMLRGLLVENGFETLEARSDQDAMQVLREGRPDLIVMDLQMPGLDGLETCRMIRRCSEVPIIAVAAKASSESKVMALDAGADQYLAKPFGSDELLAVIGAVRRRWDRMSSCSTLSFGCVEVNMQTHVVNGPNGTFHLTAKEFRLLHYFMSHPNEVISHRRLLQAVWGPDYGDEVSYLRVFVNQLRKKIEPDPKAPRHIVTELSSGYRFCFADISQADGGHGAFRAC